MAWSLEPLHQHSLYWPPSAVIGTLPKTKFAWL
jgi:hypothetical protein